MSTKAARSKSGVDEFPEPGINVMLEFPPHWSDSSDVKWTIRRFVEWRFRCVPRQGELVSWEQYMFEVIGVTSTDTGFVDICLDPATEDARQHLNAQGGMCLRDRLLLARESGTSWDELAGTHLVVPTRLMGYLQEQTELAGDGLVASVLDGGERSVDIAGLDRGAVLAALWNHSRSRYMEERTEPLTTMEGAAILTARQGRISTLFGRELQVVLTGDRFNPWLYESWLHNPAYAPSGRVTARAVVEHLRATGSVTGAP